MARSRKTATASVIKWRKKAGRKISPTMRDKVATLILKGWDTPKIVRHFRSRVSVNQVNGLRGGMKTSGHLRTNKS